MTQSRGDKIDAKILSRMTTLEWPSTTDDIAKAIDISWQTAQIHLFKLHAEDKVKYRKVGRQNQWWLNAKYDQQF